MKIGEVVSFDQGGIPRYGRLKKIIRPNQKSSGLDIASRPRQNPYAGESVLVQLQDEPTVYWLPRYEVRQVYMAVPK